MKKEEMNKKRWIAAGGILLVILFGGVLLWPDVRQHLLGTDAGGDSGAASAYAIAEAEYPEMAPYPNENEYIKSNGDFDNEGFSKVYDAWREDIKAQQREDGYADGLEYFLRASAQAFLAGNNSRSSDKKEGSALVKTENQGDAGDIKAENQENAGDTKAENQENAGDIKAENQENADNTKAENLVYSPLNVYMALGMLAEITDGESRQQILNLLGSDSIESLRTQASDVWNASYRKDGAVSSVLASSLWLNEDVNFHQSTLDTLADTYYASSYRGDVESEEFNKALQAWLNQQTGGLLEEQAGQIAFTPDTILALATTVYFQCKWNSEFNESRTEPGTFHGTAGDVTVDFMHQGGTGTYYWAEKFGAVARYLENGGCMWFILPDEGVDTETILADDQVMQLIWKANEWENQKTLIVNQAIPKFDVVSQLDLRAGLKELGVTDVFDPEISDFTPMTSDRNDIFLAKAQHDTRVAIDEEGVTAAAYTVMMTAGAGMPPEDEMDFVVDRPFLFVITNRDNLPLFMGIVNQP